MAALPARAAVQAAANAGPSASRSRPLYQGVLKQFDLWKEVATWSKAKQQLEDWIAEWSESSYGLEGELDPDRVLASTTALSALAPRDAQRAEELRDLLAGIEESLTASGGSAPDLCLAFAQGWLALRRTPAAAQIAVDEQVDGLTRALHYAEAIDHADRRDALGCGLAYALHRLRLAGGGGSESVKVVEGALASFPGDAVERAYLLSALADERRRAGDWSQAWARLQEAEGIRARLTAGGTPTDPVLERTLAGVRCQFELLWVLPDQAVQSWQREARAFDAGARDVDSHLGLLLDASGVALAVGRPSILKGSLERFESALGENGPFADRPQALAQLRARQALVQALLEDVDPEAGRHADELLDAAFADPALDGTHRASVAIKLFERALRDGYRDKASKWLDRLDPSEGGADRAAELTAFLIAARAKLALVAGASKEELPRHDKAVREQYRAFLDSFRERPERQGGLGYLAWRDRRLLVGTVLELALALEGKEQAIDRLLPEQELASLARKLACKESSIAAAQKELLRPGVGLLLYLPGWKSTHLFCVDSKGIEHEEIPWAYDLEPRPRELAELLSSSPAEFSEKVRSEQLEGIESGARELAERLLPEVAQERLRGWKGVYVAGAELLGVPFELLPFGKSRLGEKVALAYLPSVPVGLELARRSRKAGEHGDRELLLVAAPELAQATAERYQLARFALDDAETSGLTAPFEHNGFLTGKHASWSAIRSELASHPTSVLHVLTHGVNDPTRELSGGLVLAPGDGDPDGLLWCEELFAEPFVSPPLVILSACGSARGPRRLGDDGLAQLGGAFFTRGASCTVQASNDIALEPTIELMKPFLDDVAKGASSAEAMRSARVELAEKAGFGHPFYSSSMRVIGLGLERIMR